MVPYVRQNHGNLRHLQPRRRPSPEEQLPSIFDPNPKGGVKYKAYLSHNKHITALKKAVGIDQQFMMEVGEALGNLVDPKNEARTKAGDFLQQAQKRDGYATALLQISRDKNANQAQVKFEIDINHMAAI